MDDIIVSEHAFKHGVPLEDIEGAFDISAETLDKWERDAADGILHGEPRVKVVMGRPLLFGEETKQVGFREPISTIEKIDRRARQLGMKRSDYLRYLVDADLIAAGV